VRHILVKIHFLRELVTSAKISVDYVSTNEMIADMFTKQLPRQRFVENRSELGLTRVSRSEKWGSVGKDLSDRKRRGTEACMTSEDALERGESNGATLELIGEELMLLGAYQVGPEVSNCGVPNGRFYSRERRHNHKGPGSTGSGVISEISWAESWETDDGEHVKVGDWAKLSTREFGMRPSGVQGVGRIDAKEGTVGTCVDPAEIRTCGPIGVQEDWSHVEQGGEL
jgi:hypothetical protein